MTAGTFRRFFGFFEPMAAHRYTQVFLTLLSASLDRLTEYVVHVSFLAWLSSVSPPGFLPHLAGFFFSCQPAHWTAPCALFDVIIISLFSPLCFVLLDPLPFSLLKTVQVPCPPVFLRVLDRLVVPLSPWFAVDPQSHTPFSYGSTRVEFCRFKFG